MGNPYENIERTTSCIHIVMHKDFFVVLDVVEKVKKNQSTKNHLNHTKKSPLPSIKPLPTSHMPVHSLKIEGGHCHNCQSMFTLPAGPTGRFLLRYNRPIVAYLQQTSLFAISFILPTSVLLPDPFRTLVQFPTLLPVNIFI